MIASTPAPLTSTDAASLGSYLTALRRHLHAHPELGFEEYETARFIARTLAELGLTVTPAADTGAFVDIVGSRPGPVVGYRADIDALPIQDGKADVPYRSQTPGVAHLCGHDAHTTVAIGVARLLHARRDALHGTVRVFFQPNEEGTPSGAPRMIEAGVLDGLDAVYGIHVDPTLDVGTFGLIAGPVTASADRFDLVVRGPSTGHSARPHTVVDTAYLATALAQHLYTLAGRVTDARRAAVLTICRMQAGEAYNVIPQHVTLGGTLRCVDNEIRREMQQAIEQACTHFGQMHGARIDCVFHDGAPPVTNDADLVAHADATIRRLHGDAAVYVYPLPSMGAEDFAYYTERIPGAFLRVGTRSGPATSFAVHDAQFDLDERALPLAAETMAEIVRTHALRG